MNNSIINDLPIEQLYIEIKTILSGCDSKIDALRFASSYCNKYPRHKQIIMNMLNGYQYFDTIDQHIKIEMIHDMIKCDSKDDGKIIFEKMENLTNDDVMKRVMTKLLNKKKNKKYKFFNDFAKVITKKCPHCTNQLTARYGADYVICGYQNTTNGYDWIGCGRDWCFQCGKMLCKKWETHKLHCEANRSHDDKCCSRHANEHGKKYMTEYCYCRTKYVNRGDIDILYDIIDF